jgi:hypothetical protein
MMKKKDPPSNANGMLYMANELSVPHQIECIKRLIIKHKWYL